MLYLADTQHDPFAATLGTTRGLGEPARAFKWPDQEKTWTVEVAAEVEGLFEERVTFSRSDNEGPSVPFIRLSAAAYCQFLWTVPDKAHFYSQRATRGVLINGEHLLRLRAWTVQTVSLLLSSVPVQEASILQQYLRAEAAHRENVASANRDVEQAKEALRTASSAQNLAWEMQKALLPAHEGAASSEEESFQDPLLVSLPSTGDRSRLVRR